MRYRRKDLQQDILGALAQAVAEVLVLPDPARVKKCGNPDCTLVFLDTSKTGRRRWCNMGTCGNRMKVQAFRDRAKK